MERARLRPYYYDGIGETGQGLLAAAAAGAVAAVRWLWSTQQVSHEDAAAAARSMMMFLNGYCRRCCEHDREGARLFFLYPMFGLSCRSVPHAPSKPMPVLPPYCGALCCCCVEFVVVPRGRASSGMGSKKCCPNR
ncbi:unnamed protein product, partial [Ectocarpus sp. 8 AP-2014]